jgi:hypothetical protein
MQTTAELKVQKRPAGIVAQTERYRFGIPACAIPNPTRGDCLIDTDRADMRLRSRTMAVIGGRVGTLRYGGLVVRVGACDP